VRCPGLRRASSFASALFAAQTGPFVVCALAGCRSLSVGVVVSKIMEFCESELGRFDRVARKFTRRMGTVCGVSRLHRPVCTLGSLIVPTPLLFEVPGHALQKS
jgi:hypothetical protein